MVRAVQEFFPESGILDDEGVVVPAHPRASSASGQERPHPLRRLNTGLSSIVSNTNGEKPGGFVLVIDGTALGFVSPTGLCRC
jgi:phospholipid-translocating ATPase